MEKSNCSLQFDIQKSRPQNQGKVGGRASLFAHSIIQCFGKGKQLLLNEERGTVGTKNKHV